MIPPISAASLEALYRRQEAASAASIQRTQPAPAGSASGQIAAAAAPLSLGALPELTRELCEKILAADQLFLRGASTKAVTNPPLRCMCYLRGLRFLSTAPTKAEMISALDDYVSAFPEQYLIILSKMARLPIQRKDQALRSAAIQPIQVASLDALYHLQMQAATEAQAAAAAEIQPEHDAEPPEDTPPKGKKTGVLGAQTLAEYAKDRANMVLPPWISAPPARAGHTDHGKLSADQWRVLCTVNLPITLIRLWGSEDEDSRWKKMLDNFLDMVVAVEIASLVVISEELIQEYEHRMHRYLVTLKDLYKDAPICPNQHNALHLGDHMRGFGPSPGFRIFGTERFNQNLQRVNTNHHFSELVGAFSLHPHSSSCL